jgi:2-hydroxy-3-keto-5-methylthiopentenyl-1-phosphate phosphatase
MKNCILIGTNAGSNMESMEDYTVIIGDNIPDLDPSHSKNTTFIGDRLAIGEYLFGKKLNFREILLDWENERKEA